MQRFLVSGFRSQTGGVFGTNVLRYHGHADLLDAIIGFFVADVMLRVEIDAQHRVSVTPVDAALRAEASRVLAASSDDEAESEDDLNGVSALEALEALGGIVLVERDGVWLGAAVGHSSDLVPLMGSSAFAGTTQIVLEASRQTGLFMAWSPDRNFLAGLRWPSLVGIPADGCWRWIDPYRAVQWVREIGWVLAVRNETLHPVELGVALAIDYGGERDLYWLKRPWDVVGLTELTLDSGEVWAARVLGETRRLHGLHHGDVPAHIEVVR